MEHQTVYKCCPGWVQHNNEPGCLHCKWIAKLKEQRLIISLGLIFLLNLPSRIFFLLFITRNFLYKEAVYFWKRKLLLKIQKLLYAKVPSNLNFELIRNSVSTAYSCCSFFVPVWLWQANQSCCCYPNYANKSAVRHLFLGHSTPCGVWLVWLFHCCCCHRSNWLSTLQFSIWWEPVPISNF